MPKFEVWMEGYLATGMEGVPSVPDRIAIVEADSFQAACDIVGARKKWSSLYDKETRSMWGCRLYPTLEEAIDLFKDYKYRHPPTYSE